MMWAFRIFVVIYAIALVLLAIGTFGWFGQEKDPLSAVFLFPLGLPWNVLADKAGIAGPAAMVLAPAVTAAILCWLAYRRRHSPTHD